jgi:hypothetical protein
MAKPVQLNKPLTTFKIFAKEPSWIMAYHRQPRSDLRVEKYCTFVPAGNELTITLDAGKNLYLVLGDGHF